MIVLLLELAAMTTLRLALTTVLAVCAAACSSPPGTADLAQDALTAMGGAERVRAIRTVQFRDGTGTRFRVGQTVKVGEAEEPTTLSMVVETTDLANGRASLNYALAMKGGFSQQRHEVLTTKDGRGVGLEYVMGRPLAVMSPSGLFSWGTQNSPEISLRRNIITVLLAAAAATSADRTVTLPSGETLTLSFDPESKLLTGYETTDTETMLGDLPAQYRFADYRDVGGVRLPHKMTVTKGGQPYSDVQFASAAINDAGADAVFTIPAEANADVDRAIAAGDYSPVTLAKVADGVYHARGYSHHSMVVEFPSFLAVVEAPYSEAQSKTLVRALQMQLPGKPIRYVAITHHHYDHTGGVRGLAAQGAAVLVEKGHEVALKTIVESPHSYPADELATKRNAGQTVATVETFEGKKVISEGGQTLELHAITGNPHVDPKVIAYVPTSGVLFQSDLFIPGIGLPAGPEAIHLHQAVQKLGLRVQTNVGGHGGVAPYAELAKAAAATAGSR